MSMSLMGSTNKHWGVCGFTSSFYAMYKVNPGKRALLIGAGVATKVLAEIKTYLMMLKADGNIALLNEIETFTRSFGKVPNFGDFSNFQIDAYIQHINQAVSRTDSEITADPYYSIAMPPNAVADYLKRIWEYDSEVQTVAGGAGGVADGIIGVTDGGGMKLYDGLCHYMYRHGGKIHSWGESSRASLAPTRIIRWFGSSR